MSLLTRGPHTVTVIPREDTGDKDRYNSPITRAGQPIQVTRVMVQPLSVEEIVNRGLQVLSTVRIIGKGTWPGAPTASIEIFGDRYEQKGPVEHHRVSPRTSHYIVVAQRNGPLSEG